MAVYQLAFFAAVADTGVAVGTIVALGLGARAHRPVRVDRRRPPPSPAGRWRPRSPAPASRCSSLAGGAADVSAPGVALAVTAGGAYAVYTLAAKRLLATGHAPESGHGRRRSGSARSLLLPALLATQPTWLLHTDGIALALFLGIVPTALAYLLFASGLRRLTPPRPPRSPWPSR